MLYSLSLFLIFLLFFFFNDTATTEIYTLSLHDALPIHHALDRRGLLPAEHYVDSGYPSAELVADAARDYGIALISPMLLDTSRQARAGTGLHAAAFTIDWHRKQVTCPQGQR